ncbi:MAG: hypothetical protein KAS23_08410 [Anaerohalosphaera sp.]|nr:hypothetical protein [Anaerohalosphaera sp.]
MRRNKSICFSRSILVALVISSLGVPVMAKAQVEKPMEEPAKEPVGKHYCSDFVWKDCWSKVGRYYVLYKNVIPSRTNLYAYVKSIGLDKKIDINEFCEYGFGKDQYMAYSGEGKPEPIYFGLEVFVNNSATAARIQELEEGVEVLGGDSEYSEHPWTVRYVRAFSRGEVNSVKQFLADKGIKVAGYNVFNDSSLLFFGRCLSVEDAEMVKKKLDLHNIPVILLKLNYIEMDL